VLVAGETGVAVDGEMTSEVVFGDVSENDLRGHIIT
jgi:hypothetical protein